MVNRQQLAIACERLYRRAGGSTARSGIYAELNENLRGLIASSVGFTEGELPIVASVVDGGHWLVATTDRVAYRTGGEVVSLPLHRVQAVHSLALEDGNVERGDVVVLVVDGQRHEAQIEAGYPMGGVWNVLRRLVRAWETGMEVPRGSEGPTRH
jgi:hypothetical protein